MKTRDYLNRGFQLSRRLEVKKAARDSLGKVISRYEANETQTDHRNTSEDTAIRWSELQKEIEEMESTLRRIDKETDEIISQLPNANEYAVLYCRFIRRLSWKEVAKETRYSEQHVFRLYQDGLRACKPYIDVAV
jgi:DNA-directed RNA polymerase specialized sigma subunit